MTACEQAAIEYREAGFHPIPVGRDKRPLVQWKLYQTEMPTEDQIHLWYAQWPTANVGLIMGGGVMAVDVDGPEGEQALAQAGMDLTGLPTVRTARGRHVYLAGQEIPDRIGLLPKIDIRGAGYVVAPPSVHESGAIYFWETPITGALPTGPAKLYDMIRNGQRPAGATSALGGTDWCTQALVGVAEGGRDVVCTRLAGYLLGKGIPQDAAELILQRWAESCSPPFPADQVSKCVESIAKREGVPDGPPQPLAEALARVLGHIEKPPMGGDAEETGFERLSELMDGGFRGGELTYLGARPGVGKSAWALQVGRHVGRKTGVIYCSREMTVDALVRRMLVQESKVPLQALKRVAKQPLDDIHKRMLQVGAERLLPIQMWLTTDVNTPGQLDAVLETYTKGVLGLVVVDYLQIMSSDEYSRDSRARVEDISKRLKQLSIKWNLPFLVLSSLSRPPRDANWEPGLSDLRESGELEHDADSVFFLHRPDLNQAATTFILAKQRDGGVGRFPLTFDGPRVTFN